jgi:hypothetical protein
MVGAAAMDSSNDIFSPAPIKIFLACKECEEKIKELKNPKMLVLHNCSVWTEKPIDLVCGCGKKIEREYV